MTEIIQDPNDLLHVNTFDSDNTSELSLEEIGEKLLQIFDEMEGAIGLAAPQVGVIAPVAVVGIPNRESRFVIINPEITFESRQRESSHEGCLSLEGNNFITT